MLTKDRDLHIPQEVIDYLNTYPAFRETHGERINDRFFDKYVSDAIAEVHIEHRSNRAIANEPENQPIANYCNAIWYLDGYMMTMEEAEDLLRWMEPRWCEFRGIGSSGFFHEDSITLNEDEDFVV